MTRHLHIEPVDLVDIHELFAENIQREVGRHSRLSSLRDRAGSRFNPGRIISGDLFFLICGALVGLDTALVIWLSQR